MARTRSNEVEIRGVVAPVVFVAVTGRTAMETVSANGRFGGIDDLPIVEARTIDPGTARACDYLLYPSSKYSSAVGRTTNRVGAQTVRALADAPRN